MARLAYLVIPLVMMFAACSKANPRYCEGHPDDSNCVPDAAGSGSGPACSSSPDCKTAQLPVCDTAKEGGQCVACTQADHGVCGGMTPRCENDSCVACLDDGDCPSSVCLLNGACADAATVVHAVATGGLTTMGCGQLPPTGQGACTLETAISNAKGNAPTVIKLDDNATYTPVGNLILNTDVTLDLRIGATLTRRNTDGAAITVNGPGKLTVLGGTITGGHGTNGNGIACNTGGTLVVDRARITANEASAIETTNCAVTITRAQIDNNNPTGGFIPAIRVSGGGSITMVRNTVQTNRGGGLDVNSAIFTIVSNVFSGNGDPGSGVGGIQISSGLPGSRLDFNSIAENKTQGGTAAGVDCTANVGFTAANNIIWNNRNNSSPGLQVFGGCGHAYSDIGPTAIMGGITVSNLQNVDPLFVNATTDLHLSATSPLTMLQADPQANLDIAALDIDGEKRIAPVTMGADQPRTK